MSIRKKKIKRVRVKPRVIYDKPIIGLPKLTRYSLKKMNQAGISLNYNEILTIYKYFVGIFYQELCAGDIVIDKFGKFSKCGNDFSITLDEKLQKIILSNLDEGLS
jgi:hypothetical protein